MLWTDDFSRNLSVCVICNTHIYDHYDDVPRNIGVFPFAVNVTELEFFMTMGLYASRFARGGNLGRC